jgi:FtsP/CotA-like multicopper oxidase with cupredoxin domain
MTSARVGTYLHWRIVNATAELHPFHIHPVHFLAYAQNGAPLPDPAWLRRLFLDRLMRLSRNKKERDPTNGHPKITTPALV